MVGNDKKLSGAVPRPFDQLFGQRMPFIQGS